MLLLNAERQDITDSYHSYRCSFYEYIRTPQDVFLFMKKLESVGFVLNMICLEYTPDHTLMSILPSFKTPEEFIESIGALGDYSPPFDHAYPLGWDDIYFTVAGMYRSVFIEVGIFPRNNPATVLFGFNCKSEQLTHEEILNFLKAL